MIAHYTAKILGRSLTWRIGRALYLAARDEAGNEIATNGEAALIRTVAHANRDNGPLQVWDVGGHIGKWTQSALDAAAGVGMAVAVNVFEPSPGAADYLTSKFNGNPNVVLHRHALGAEAGAAKMDIFAPTQGTNALTIDGEVTGAETITVDVKTGDAVGKDLGAGEIHLIKIDAEGHDLAIISGCFAMLEAGRVQVMQFEYNHRWIATKTSLRQLMAMIKFIPYRLAKVTKAGLEIIPDWNPEADRYFETNYALIRNDMLDKLGARHCAWNESNVLVHHR